MMPRVIYSTQEENYILIQFHEIHKKLRGNINIILPNVIYLKLQCDFPKNNGEKVTLVSNIFSWVCFVQENISITLKMIVQEKNHTAINFSKI